MTDEREQMPILDKAKPVQRLSADESGQEHAGVSAADRSLVDRVVCRAGDNSCATAHASTLNRATSSKPSRAEHSLLQLQRQYGNRYVERVLTLARKTSSEGEADTGTSADVESAIHKERGGGNNLDSGVRRQMEGALGADFSGVRVHVDTHATPVNLACAQVNQVEGSLRHPTLFYRFP